MAQALQQVVNRSSDLVARFGGEEFAILLPETDADAAAQLADACLSAIAALAMRHPQSPAGGNLGISIGTCTLVVTAASTPELLITQADQALYQAKRSGRNRYCQFAPAANDAAEPAGLVSASTASDV